MKKAISTTVLAVIFIVVIVIVAAGVYAISRPATSGTSSSSSISAETITSAVETTTSSSSSSTSISSSSSVVSSALVPTSSSSSTTTISSSSSTKTNGTITVLENLAGQLNDLNTRNVEALGNYYTDTSVVNWTGDAGGLGGVYTGTSNIIILYIGSFSHVTNLVVHTANLSATAQGAENVSLNFDLSMEGYSTQLGNLTARVLVTQDWQNQAGTWSIQNETWDYLSFTTTNPVTSTVFPQWGLALEGRNPDLASEHLLEWYAAPYVAGGIYASIVAIFFIAMVKKRSRRSQS